MKKKINKVLCYLFITIMCCISSAIVMVCKWAKGTFNVSLNAIINTLLSPLKGTSSDTVLPAVRYCLPVVLTVLALCVIYIVWDNRKGNTIVRTMVTVLSIVSIVPALVYVQASYDVMGYIVTKNQETNFYKENYIAPYDVTIKEPENRRNLLFIYMESMENTYTDVESGGADDKLYAKLYPAGI